jgi:hypothetical protein
MRYDADDLGESRAAVRQPALVAVTTDWTRCTAGAGLTTFKEEKRWRKLNRPSGRCPTYAD